MTKKDTEKTTTNMEEEVQSSSSEHSSQERGRDVVVSKSKSAKWEEVSQRNDGAQSAPG